MRDDATNPSCCTYLARIHAGGTRPWTAALHLPNPGPEPRAAPIPWGWSATYYDWLIDRVFLLVPAQAYVANFLRTFKEFPPRQKPASFSIDQVMEKLQSRCRLEVAFENMDESAPL